MKWIVIEQTSYARLPLHTYTVCRILQQGGQTLGSTVSSIQLAISLYTSHHIMIQSQSQITLTVNPNVFPKKSLVFVAMLA